MRSLRTAAREKPQFAASREQPGGSNEDLVQPKIKFKNSIFPSCSTKIAVFTFKSLVYLEFEVV